MEIILKDVCFYYKRGNIKREDVLKGINLCLREGGCYLLTGDCGSGKTTLALLMKGLLTAQSGSITVEHSSMSLASLQKSIGYVFQFPEEQFFKETVKDEVSFGPITLGLDRIEERVKNALSDVGLEYERYSQSSPFTLSSGEKRRLAIASTIACEPSWYIFDEPMAGLDLEGRVQMINLVKHLIREKKTVLVISQELELFLEISDRIIVLKNGKAKLDCVRSTFLGKEDMDGMEVLLPYHIRVLRILRKRGWDIPVSIMDPKEAANIIDEYVVRTGDGV